MSTQLKSSSNNYSQHQAFGNHRKNLTPALSTLLSSTKIPCSRKKRPSTHSKQCYDTFNYFPTLKESDLPQTAPLTFTKKSISSPPQQHPSQIRKRLGLGQSKGCSHGPQQPSQEDQFCQEPVTNLALRIHSPLLPGQLRNDLMDPAEEEAVQQQQLFSMEYAVSSDSVRHTIGKAVGFTPSTSLWQLLEQETPEADDDEEDDDDTLSSSSFSSLDSSLSSRCPASLTSLSSSSCGSSVVTPRKLLKRKSLSVLRSGNRIVSPCSEFSSVDDLSHPLADFIAADQDKDVAEMESSPRSYSLKKSLSFVSHLSASLKALTSAASSFSASNQALLSSTDVFTFSPRSTDEPIPRNVIVRPEIAPLRSGRGMTVPSRTRSKINLQPAVVTPVQPQQSTESAEVPPPPKVIALETYSVQEFTLPPPPRARDIRENPDFLRIYALEVLMRKHGKLDLNFPGKAQVALMPRADKIPDTHSPCRRFPKYQSPTSNDPTCRPHIPARWVGISA